jgi:hypothetical protein
MALFEESYTRILTLPDCHWMHREAKEEENGNPSCQLRFPALSVRENDGSTWRLLSDPCAVCLHQYQVGDSVVWSPNDTLSSRLPPALPRAVAAPPGHGI